MDLGRIFGMCLSMILRKLCGYVVCRSFLWSLPNDNSFSFGDELIYLSALPLTKISILLFYLRIFPRRGFKYGVYTLLVANIMYLIAFELVSIWQCQPLRGAWKRWDGEFRCKCNNINLQGWTSASINILFDLCILGLPLPEIYRLSLSNKKKFQVMLMFCLGIL